MSEFRELFDIGFIFVFTIIFIFGVSQQIIYIQTKKRRVPAKKITKQDLERSRPIQKKTEVSEPNLDLIQPGTLIQGRKLLYRHQFNDKFKERVKKYLIDKWDTSSGITDDVLWYWAPSCLTEYYLADG